MLSDPGAHPARGASWIFVGPHGVRAGWGILLFCVLWLVLYLSLQWVCLPLLQWDASRPMPPRAGIIVELCQFVPAVIATGIMAVLERRSIASYGFQGSSRIVRLVSGIAWGFIAISLLVLALSKLGYLQLTRASQSPQSVFAHAAAWGFVFLLAGFFEEAVFRGYIQFTLTRGIGFWWGALLFAAVFGLTHIANTGESPIGLASVVGAGLVFSFSLWYTGSLWWAVGFHATWDWGQSFFYGTPDSGLISQGHFLEAHPIGPVLWSGGATGPEGSILVLPWLAMMALSMYIWWGRRTQSPFAGSAWKPKRGLPAAAPPSAELV